jgi:hypothetical protein
MRVETNQRSIERRGNMDKGLGRDKIEMQTQMPNVTPLRGFCVHSIFASSLSMMVATNVL